MNHASPLANYIHAAHIVHRALTTVSKLCQWIARTGDSDLPRAPHLSARTLRDAAPSLRAHALDLDTLAERLNPP